MSHDPTAPDASEPKPAAETADASRRTRLANERTFLAWWRTGLTAFAVSLGAGKLVPELADEHDWTYLALGVAFAGLGTLCIAYAFVRQRRVERALDSGTFAPTDERLVAALTSIGVLLGLGLVAALLL